MSTHRQRTRRNTRVAQVSALVLGAGAAALGLTRMPQGEGATIVPPPPLPAQGQDALATAVDFDSALRVMNELVEKKFRPTQIVQKNPDPPAPTPPDPPIATPPPPPPFDWRYVGSIIGPGTSHAIVMTTDGHQRLVAQGEKVDDITLISVSPTKLVVQTSAGERDVAIETRPQNQAPESRVGTLSEAPAPDFSKVPPDQRAQMEQEWAQRKAEAEKRNATRPPTAQPARPPPRPSPGPPGKPAIDPKSGEKLSRNTQ